MDIRHLDALLAIAETGSFSAAAEVLHTVQSNVSEQIRQLERELGVPVLVRGRRGATPTEFGLVVLERARRVRGELEAMRVDLSLLQGLEAGHASLGVVGTASRWLVPALVADLRQRAPGVHLRINEGASERLAAEVVAHEVTMAVVTEPILDARLAVEHLLEEDLVGLVPDTVDLGPAPVAFSALAAMSLILPPSGNPFRLEIDEVAAAHGLTLSVPVEVEGVRLIADLVAAGRGASILPETAVPPGLTSLRTVSIIGMPPRRLALVTARHAYLSLADRAVRDSVRRLVNAHRAA
ncbi:MAG: LysR substrate-binding domain-containing protein [Actinomycetota bacterium]|nr:LysR substrate-binding domain-containing protein [Actinomycetota bacterium]